MSRGHRLVLAALWTSLAAGCGEPPPESVVLVVVDTLRADHLGLYGHHRPTSPELDRWADGAAIFEHGFSASPWTLPSMATMLTGQLPSRHRAGTFDHELSPPKRFQRLDPRLPTLPELLTEAGFSTWASMNNAFLHPRFGLDRGFDTYDFEPCNRACVRRADKVVDSALAWLDVPREQPFFMLLHMFDPHLDYDPPAETAGLFSTGVKQTGAPRILDLKEIRGYLRRGEAFDWSYLEALYDEEIVFVDRQLGRFFGELERRGLDRDTLVIVTSDHGEEFFDHDRFEHGHSLYNELLRVPFLVRGPGVRAGRLDSPMTLADLLPTVLELLGREPPAELHGRSLAPLLGGGSGPEARPLFAERTLYGPERRAIFRWPQKLIQNLAAPGRPLLFDLAADAGETSNLATQEAAAADQLRQALAVLDHVAAPGDDGVITLDPESEAALRSLGYVR